MNNQATQIDEISLKYRILELESDLKKAFGTIYSVNHQVSCFLMVVKSLENQIEKLQEKTHDIYVDVYILSNRIETKMDKI